MLARWSSIDGCRLSNVEDIAEATGVEERIGVQAMGNNNGSGSAPCDVTERGHSLSTATASDLDSWKDISAYFNRSVRTVQRWERLEGMPVHRHVHGAGGSVYALRQELDAWRASRTLSGQRHRRMAAVDQLPIKALPQEEQAALRTLLEVILERLGQKPSGSIAGPVKDKTFHPRPRPDEGSVFEDASPSDQRRDGNHIYARPFLPDVQ